MDRKTFRQEVTLPAKDYARIHHVAMVGDHVFTVRMGWVNRHSLYRSTVAMMLSMVPRYRITNDKKMARACLSHTREALEYHRNDTKHTTKA